MLANRVSGRAAEKLRRNTNAGRAAWQPNACGRKPPEAEAPSLVGAAPESVPPSWMQKRADRQRGRSDLLRSASLAAGARRFRNAVDEHKLVVGAVDDDDFPDPKMLASSANEVH